MNHYPKKLELLSDRETKYALFALDEQIGMRIDGYLGGIFRIRVGQLEQLTDRTKAYDMLSLNPDLEALDFQVESKSSGYQLLEENYRIELQRQPFFIRIYRDGRLVWSTSSAYEEPLAWSLATDEVSKHHWGLMVDLTDTRIFGFGKDDVAERNGQYIASTDTLFQPFGFTNRSWGLYTHSWWHSEHHLGIESDTYELYCEGDLLDCFVLTGATPSDVMSQYMMVRGQVTQVPFWAVGMSLAQPPHLDNESFVSLAKTYREAGIAIDNLVFALPSFVKFLDNKPQLEWDESRQDDVEVFLDTLHQQQWHAYVPTVPAVFEGTPLFEELEDRAWLLQDDQGYAYRFDASLIGAQGRFALLDLTYKDARTLWFDWHKQVTAQHVDGVVCALPVSLTEGVYARNGQTGVELDSLYRLHLYATVQEAAASHRVPVEVAMLSDRIRPDTQPYTWQSLKAAQPSWQALSRLLEESLSLGNSGQPVLQWQLEQLLQSEDKQLVLRALSLAVFSAGFTLPASEAFLRLLAEDETGRVAHWLSLRSRLLPYVYGLIEDAVRSGTPVQRSMAFAFAHDDKAAYFTHQFLFGPSILIAPALDPTLTTMDVYLPDGEAWWDLNTGVRYEGGQVINMPVSDDYVLAFGREGYILCLGPELRQTSDFNTAKVLDEVWMFDMPVHNPVVMRNKIRVMQMQGSSYLRGLEGLRILKPDGIEVKRRGAEVRISRER